MASVSDFVRAVGAFMDKPKFLVSNTAPTWSNGREPDALRLKLPIEIDGEQSGQSLVIFAYPEHKTLKFTVGIQFGDHVVCRFDHELEAVHGNNGKNRPMDLPRTVYGPHWHDWELNKCSFSSTSEYFKMPYAQPLSVSRSFDAGLRWYCNERKMKLGFHEIEFPSRRRLL